MRGIKSHKILGPSLIEFNVNKDSVAYKMVRALQEFGRKARTIIVSKEQGRNEICNCGSGLKFKRCCGK